MQLQRTDFCKRAKCYCVPIRRRRIRQQLLERDALLLQWHALWQLHQCLLCGRQRKLMLLQRPGHKFRLVDHRIPIGRGAIGQNMQIAAAHLQPGQTLRNLCVWLLCGQCQRLLHVQRPLDTGRRERHGIPIVVRRVRQPVYLPTPHLHQRNAFRLIPVLFMLRRKCRERRLVRFQRPNCQ